MDSLFKKSLKRSLSSASDPEIKKLRAWETIKLGPKSWIKKIDLDQSNGGIDAAMFEKLWALKPNEKLKIKINGHVIPCPRYSRTYLNDYFFTNMAHKMEKETPDIIMDLFTKLNNFTGIDFNQILVNWYDVDGSIGAHSDDTSQLVKNSEILSVSYFEKDNDFRMFLVDPKFDKNLETTHVVLKHNTCVIMGGECQNTHKHSVPKVVDGGKRINITCRKFKKLVEFDLK
jgi:alkylated DNA repair dioxygenase AlkB